MRILLALTLLSSAALAQERAVPPASSAASPPAPPSASPPAPPSAPPSAPVNDADVQRIHVVEQRPFTEANRWELTLSAPVQVNPKFTIHAGLTAELAYHLRENLALQLGLIWFPIAYQSTLSEELLTKADEAPLTAEAFLLQGAAIAGLELMPIYGKLNVFDGKILRLGFYINAGLGLGKTELQLRPSTDTFGRSYGDTGFRPVAALGGGFRVFVTEQVTVRLELRDFAYSGYVSRVNGCSLADTQAISTNPDNPGSLSSGCNAGAFGDTAQKRRLNATGAKDLLKPPSSAEVINNIAFMGGVSYLF
jgi:outer membrane beta-barrel protein